MEVVNQVEQKLEKVKKKPKYSRSLIEMSFKYEKYWCYQKNEHWEDGRKFKSGHYCYNCKNELFFKWKSDRKTDSPFKVHGIYLESKSRINEYGREEIRQYFKAYCCKCWNEWVNTYPLAFSKCDCRKFINSKKKEAEEEVMDYSARINGCNFLIGELEIVKRKCELAAGKEDFLSEQVNDFIGELKETKEKYQKSLQITGEYLELYNQWECKLKELIG
jgi:hypothetical protein